MTDRGQHERANQKARPEGRAGAGADADPREAVYRERAAALANRSDQDGTADAGPTQAVLTFTLGGERYGIDLTRLGGVVPYAHCTPVPGGPAELAGVINHRGRLCCVLDLARLLQLPSAAQPQPDQGGKKGAVEGEPAEPGYVLLLRKPARDGGREGRNEIGLKVNRVETIVQVGGADLRRPGDESGTATPFLEGVRTTDRLRLLCCDAILSHQLLAEAPGE